MMTTKAFQSSVQPAIRQAHAPTVSEPQCGELRGDSPGEFVVGEWLVRPQRNELQHRDQGISRHLEPRLSKLLCYLAACGTEVVDRDTLVSLLWPRVIVNENSLTRAVSDLRRQLSSPDGKELTYIETIPKRGYRLCLDVEVAAASSNGKSETATDTQLFNPGISETAAVTQISNSGKCDTTTGRNTPISASSRGSVFPFLSAIGQSVAAALCLALALVLVVWLQPQSPVSEDGLSTAQWSDELVMPGTAGVLQDGIVVSASNPLYHENSVTRVMSQDKEQFAFVHYDQTGSTLFLGQVSSDFEPVPVFSSRDIIHNLTWSPVGNALIFASKPPLRPALLDEERGQTAELYSFNLDTFKLSRLVEQSPTHSSPADNGELILS